jgi:hypothetical protein
MPRGSSRAYRLQVLITPALNARLNKAADRSRVSKGEWVRRVIERALADQYAVDPLERLSSLGAPSADIEIMLAEIEQGRR